MPYYLDEWVPVATTLSEKGNYVIVLVYTHYLRKRSPAELLSFLHDKVMTETLQASRVIVMGKSLGGSLAQEFALKYPQTLLALVLVAPATSAPDRIASFCPTPIPPPSSHSDSDSDSDSSGSSSNRLTRMPFPLFLAWAADDPSYRKSKVWLERCRRNTSSSSSSSSSSFFFYSAKSGGHRVLPEYGAPLLTFFDTQHVSESKSVSATAVTTTS
jgi:pimeloyl-ACP methyl ester carboxylesterase